MFAVTQPEKLICAFIATLTKAKSTDFRNAYKASGLPTWHGSKESTCNVGDPAGAMGSISGSGKSPGVGHGNLLQ